MDIELVEKPSFEVIGKVGEGNSQKNSEWILPLWKDFNKNINEIKEFVKVDEKENISGLWGIMNDINNNFAPWKEKGKYMAGVEVKEGSNPPAGWTKWKVPGYKYLKVKCSLESYSSVFSYVMNEYMLENKYSIIGNVQEYYIPGEKDGNFYLFFPIGSLSGHPHGHGR